jgi:N-acetylneuraminic acid mutarotase
VASAVLYDPVTGTWSSTGAMATPRSQQTATLLQNGRVLVAGGTDATLVPFDSAELYDPATGTWSTTGTMITARRLDTATLLLDGRVAVAGGLADTGAQNPVLARTETYDPSSGTWSHEGKLRDARWGHMATLLLNGQVLVAGGSEKSGALLASAELFQP